jgi:DNA polymerase-3 subunit beta
MHADADGKVRMYCTDLDAYGYVEIDDCNVEEAGSTCVANAKYFYDCLRLMDDPDRVQLLCEHREGYDFMGKHYDVGDWLVLHGMDTTNKLFQLPAEDYPCLPENVEGMEFDVAATPLLSAFHHTLFAASKEETRSILMGVLFDFGTDETAGCLKLVATDTHRLSCVQLAVGSNVKGFRPKSILPAHFLASITKPLKKHEGDISVTLSDSQAQFQFGNLRFVTRLLDGKFPNYEKVIPNTVTAANIITDRKRLLRGMQQVWPAAKQNSEKVIIDIAESGLNLSASTQDGIDTQTKVREVVVEKNNGMKQFAINTRYLREYLTHQDCSRIQIAINGALNPLVVTGYDQDSSVPSYLHVLMPMQV